MAEMKMTHTFVICAYRESPYLEECVRSLFQQEDRESRILIATGTPNDSIDGIADRYGLKVCVNPEGAKGLGADWDFALSCADTDLVTLAHQDDIYLPGYVRKIREAAEHCAHPLILFTDYGERRQNGEQSHDVYDNRLLHVKRMLLTPLKSRRNWDSVFWRRRILSLGSAICCPAVTLCQKNLPSPVFDNDMISNIDWAAWERITKLPGEFAYVPEPLMLHRIHEGSTTSELLLENGRRKEDLIVLEKFWPKGIASILEHFYAGGEASNRTGT